MPIISTVVISWVLILVGNVQSYPHATWNNEMFAERPDTELEIIIDIYDDQDLTYENPYDYYLDENGETNLFNDYNPYVRNAETNLVNEHNPYGDSFDVGYPQLRSDDGNELLHSSGNESTNLKLTYQLEIHCQIAIVIRQNIINALNDFLTKIHFTRPKGAFLFELRDLIDKLNNREITTISFNKNLYELHQLQYKDIGLSLLSQLGNVSLVGSHMKAFSKYLAENPRIMNIFTGCVYRHLFRGIDEKVIRDFSENDVDTILQKILKNDNVYTASQSSEYFSPFWYQVIEGFLDDKVTPTPLLLGCMIMDLPLNSDPDFMRNNYVYIYNALSEVSYTQKSLCAHTPVSSSTSDTLRVNQKAPTMPKDESQQKYADNDEQQLSEDAVNDKSIYDYESPALRALSSKYPQQSKADSSKNFDLSSSLRREDNMNVIPLNQDLANGIFNEYNSNSDSVDEDYPQFRVDQGNNSLDSSDNEATNSKLTYQLEIHCQIAIVIRQNIINALNDFLTKIHFTRPKGAFLFELRDLIDKLNNREITTISFNKNLYELNRLQYKDIGMSLLRQLGNVSLIGSHMKAFSKYLAENPRILNIFTGCVYRHLFRGIDEKVIRDFSENDLDTILQKIVKNDNVYEASQSSEYFSPFWYQVIEGFLDYKVTPTPLLLGCMIMDLPLNADPDFMRNNYVYIYNALSEVSHTQKSLCAQSPISSSTPDTLRVIHKAPTMPKIETEQRYGSSDNDGQQISEDAVDDKSIYDDGSPAMRALSPKYPKQSTADSSKNLGQSSLGHNFVNRLFNEYNSYDDSVDEDYPQLRVDQGNNFLDSSGNESANSKLTYQLEIHCQIAIVIRQNIINALNDFLTKIHFTRPKGAYLFELRDLIDKLNNREITTISFNKNLYELNKLQYKDIGLSLLSQLGNVSLVGSHMQEFSKYLAENPRILNIFTGCVYRHLFRGIDEKVIQNFSENDIESILKKIVRNDNVYEASQSSEYFSPFWYQVIDGFLDDKVSPTPLLLGCMVMDLPLNADPDFMRNNYVYIYNALSEVSYTQKSLCAHTPISPSTLDTLRVNQKAPTMPKDEPQQKYVDNDKDADNDKGLYDYESPALRALSSKYSKQSTADSLKNSGLSSNGDSFDVGYPQLRADDGNELLDSSGNEESTNSKLTYQLEIHCQIAIVIRQNIINALNDFLTKIHFTRPKGAFLFELRDLIDKLNNREITTIGFNKNLYELHRLQYKDIGLSLLSQLGNVSLVGSHMKAFSKYLAENPRILNIFTGCVYRHLFRGVNEKVIRDFSENDLDTILQKIVKNDNVYEASQSSEYFSPFWYQVIEGFLDDKVSPTPLLLGCMIMDLPLNADPDFMRNNYVYIYNALSEVSYTQKSLCAQTPVSSSTPDTLRVNHKAPTMPKVEPEQRYFDNDDQQLSEYAVDDKSLYDYENPAIRALSSKYPKQSIADSSKNFGLLSTEGDDDTKATPFGHHLMNRMFNEYNSNGDSFDLGYPQFRADQGRNFLDSSENEITNSKLTYQLEIQCQIAIVIRQNIINALNDFLNKIHFTKPEEAFLFELRDVIDKLNNREISTISFNKNLYELNKLQYKDIGLSLLSQLGNVSLVGSHMETLSKYLAKNHRILNIFTGCVYRHLFRGIDERVVRDFSENDIDSILQKIIKNDDFYEASQSSEYFSPVWYQVIEGFLNGKVAPTPLLFGCMIMDLPLNADPDFMRNNYVYIYNALSEVSYTQKISCEQSPSSSSTPDTLSVNHKASTMQKAEPQQGYGSFDNDGQQFPEYRINDEGLGYYGSPSLEASSLMRSKQSTADSQRLDDMKVTPLGHDMVSDITNEYNSYGDSVDAGYPQFRANDGNNFSVSSDTEATTSKLTYLLEIHCQMAIVIRQNIINAFNDFLTKIHFTRPHGAFLFEIRDLIDKLSNREISTISFNKNLYELNRLQYNDVGMSLLNLLGNMSLVSTRMKAFSKYLSENSRILDVFTGCVYRHLFRGINERIIRDFDQNDIDSILQEIVQNDNVYEASESSDYFSSFWYLVIQGFLDGKVTPTPLLLGCMVMDLPLNTEPDFLRNNYVHIYNALSEVSYTQNSSCESPISSSKPDTLRVNHKAPTMPKVEPQQRFGFFDNDQQTPEFAVDDEKFYNYRGSDLEALSLKYSKQSTMASTELNDPGTTLSEPTVINSMSTPYSYRPTTYSYKQHDYIMEGLEPEARINFNDVTLIPKRGREEYTGTDDEPSKIHKEPKLQLTNSGFDKYQSITPNQRTHIADDDDDDFQEEEPFQPYRKPQLRIKNGGRNKYPPFLPIKKTNVAVDDDDDFQDEEPFQPYRKSQLRIKNGHRNKYPPFLPITKTNVAVDDDDDFQDEEPFQPYRKSQLRIKNGHRNKYQPFLPYQRINIADDDDDDFQEEEPFQPYRKPQLRIKNGRRNKYPPFLPIKKTNVAVDDDDDFQDEEPFQPYRKSQLRIKNGHRNKYQPFLPIQKTNVADDDDDDFQEEEPFQPYRKSQLTIKNGHRNKYQPFLPYQRINIADDDDDDFQEEEPFQPYRKPQLRIKDGRRNKYPPFLPIKKTNVAVDDDDDFQDEEPFQPYRKSQLRIKNGHRNKYQPFLPIQKTNVADDDDDDFQEEEPFQPYRKSQLTIKNGHRNKYQPFLPYQRTNIVKDDDTDLVQEEPLKSYSKTGGLDKYESFRPYKRTHLGKEDEPSRPYKRIELQDDKFEEQKPLKPSLRLEPALESYSTDESYALPLLKETVNNRKDDNNITPENLNLGTNEYISDDELNGDFIRGVNKDTQIFRKGIVWLYFQLIDKETSSKDIKEELKKIMDHLRGCFIPYVNMAHLFHKCSINAEKCFNRLLMWSAKNKFCNTSNGHYPLPRQNGKYYLNNDLGLLTENNTFLQEVMNADDVRDTIKKLCEQLIHVLLNSPNTDYVPFVIDKLLKVLPNKFPENLTDELKLFHNTLSFASKQKTSQDIIKYLSSAVNVIKIEVPILQISDGFHKLIDFDSLSTPLKIRFRYVLNYLLLNPQIAFKILQDTEKSNENQFLLSLFKALQNDVDIPEKVRQNINTLSQYVRLKPKYNEEN